MYSVLLVDDEPLARTVIKEKIKWNELGFELAGDCEDWKQAIEFVNEHPVDLVMTDINMPYVDGMELSRYLYTRYPDTAIVIFSGFSEFEYAQKAIQYKVMEYILKPVTASELTEVLRKVHDRLESSEKEQRRMNELTEGYHHYRKNRTAITSRILFGLSTGARDPEDAISELKESGFSLDYSIYRIASLGLHGWNAVSPPEEAAPGLVKSGGSGSVSQKSVSLNSGEMNPQDKALYSFAAENICSEILEDARAGLAFQGRDGEILFLLYSKHTAGFEAESQKVCIRCQETVHDVMHLDSFMGIGRNVRSVRELPISWESAQTAMSYRYSQGDGCLIDMALDEGRLDLDPDMTEIFSALTVEIKSCSHEKIAASFEKLKNLLRDNRVSENRCRLYLQQVFRTIFETRKLAAQPGEDLHQEEKREMDLIAKSVSLTEALTGLRSYAYASGETMRSLVSTSGELQALLATAFLNEHFAEPDLSLNGLCAYLGISASHFSSIYKEYTGMTFMEKLTGIRIEKAKELLMDTSLRNYEIAERVGYLDPHYFSIVFKKATGESPTDYARERKK